MQTALFKNIPDNTKFRVVDTDVLIDPNIVFTKLSFMKDSNAKWNLNNLSQKIDEDTIVCAIRDSTEFVNIQEGSLFRYVGTNKKVSIYMVFQKSGYSNAIYYSDFPESKHTIDIPSMSTVLLEKYDCLTYFGKLGVGSVFKFGIDTSIVFNNVGIFEKVDKSNAKLLRIPKDSMYGIDQVFHFFHHSSVMLVQSEHKVSNDVKEVYIKKSKINKPKLIKKEKEVYTDNSFEFIVL